MCRLPWKKGRSSVDVNVNADMHEGVVCTKVDPSKLSHHRTSAHGMGPVLHEHRLAKFLAREVGIEEIGRERGPSSVWKACFRLGLWTGTRGADLLSQLVLVLVPLLVLLLPLGLV
jgi:hypothetical protein